MQCAVAALRRSSDWKPGNEWRNSGRKWQHSTTLIIVIINVVIVFIIIMAIMIQTMDLRNMPRWPPFDDEEEKF